MPTLAPTWNFGDTATAKWYVRLFPSLNDIAFLLPIVVLFARMNGTRLLFSDGDTGWHILTGNWILAHRAVPTTDLFSFTRSNQPWYAWEWAWDVLAALVHRGFGLAGVGFITALMLGIFSLLVYRLALRVSGNHLTSIAVTALTVAVSSIHWLARPHLVSWLFLLAFLHALESVRSPKGASNALLLVGLPVLTLAWANLHGGFVAGLLIIACYALGEAFTDLLTAGTLRSAFQASAIYWKSLLFCAAATLVNPYGWNLHRHIISYLSDGELLDKIQEFQSISFHAGPAIFLEILLLLGTLAVYRSLRRRQFTPVLLMCLWGHFALLSARHIPLFAIVAAPFAAELLAAGMKRAGEFPVFTGLSETLCDISTDLRSLEFSPRVHLLSAGTLLLIAALFAAGQPPFAAEFNAEAFPGQAVPVLRSHLGSRIFTTDQWGDFLLYRFYPAQRVFFDGRSDFYGNDFVKLNQHIAGAEHDWKPLLQRFAIDLVLSKPETPLSAVLKLTPGAKVLFDDGKVIVFDTRGIYPRVSSSVSRIGDRLIGVPSPSQTRLPRPREVAVTAPQANKSQKGRPS
jgi:hypothetical protein